MMLENGHYIHNALEGLQPQKCGNLHRTPRWYCLVVAIHRSRFQTATFIVRPGLDKPHRVLDDHAAGPGVRPFLKNRVASDRVFQTGDEALLSLPVVRRKQKREQVEVVHVFVKDSTEIIGACVFPGSGDALLFSHGHLLLLLLAVSGPSKSTNNIARHVFNHFFQIASGSHRHLRASRFSTCRVRTPAQENLAPSFIRSTIASSPSRLITVRLLRSITSLRPSKSRLAFLQVVRSSATHGPLSFPSTTSLRCAGVSTMEILNILKRTTQRCTQYGCH